MAYFLFVLRHRGFAPLHEDILLLRVSELSPYDHASYVAVAAADRLAGRLGVGFYLSDTQSEGLCVVGGPPARLGVCVRQSLCIT